MLLSHVMLKVWYWKSLLKRSEQSELINQHACQSLTNYYSINLLNKKTASELYEKIWCFYTERHGNPNWETKKGIFTKQTISIIGIDFFNFVNVSKIFLRENTIKKFMNFVLL